MSKQVRVNVTTIVNKSKVRRETRNGRDVVIVPSATLPDDIVMNGSAGPVLYPAEEIGKSYRQLERTPAPLGHPMVNGRFVSASDPEGLNLGWIGAWNENVRRENGRVFLDKVIDVEVANRSDGGARVLKALEGTAPVHTSTGLLARMEVVNDASADHKYIARDLVFDHDAILLDEQGAATPEKGVGIFVNSSGAEEEVEVINSTLEEDMDRSLDWLAEEALRLTERADRLPLLERIKKAIRDAVTGSEEPETVANEETLSVNEEQLKALTDKVDGVATAVAGIGDQVAAAVANALKPVTDQLTANAAAEQAKAAEAKAKLIDMVVNAGLLDKDTADKADLAVLNALAAKPGKSITVNGAFNTQGDDKGGYKLPSGE